MGYAESVWERAMQVQEVVFRAMAGEIHGFRAADILGVSARTMRRWRERYEQHGPDAFFDRRRETPSRRRASGADLAHVLQLYRERYRGFSRRSAAH